MQHTANNHSYHTLMSIFGTHQPVTGGCWKAPVAALEIMKVLCFVRVLKQVGFIFVGKSSAKRKQLCSVHIHLLMLCLPLLGAVALTSLQSRGSLQQLPIRNRMNISFSNGGS